MICLVWTIVVLYYATTIHLEDMQCLGDRREPQNCRANATSTNLAIMIPMLHLNCTAYLTTGFLAIVRFIQIKYPFYRVRKSRVLLSLLLFELAQTALWTFMTFSPFDQKIFLPGGFSVMPQNPYNLKDEFKKYSQNISAVPLIIVQGLAAIASLLTAVTLFQKRNSVGATDSSSVRSAGAVRVLLVNVPSFFFVLMFGSPISVQVVERSQKDYELVSERDGWALFFLAYMFSVVTSIWNPIIFISLTPKSRKIVRRFFA